jgi:hypothetical protein
MNSSDENCMNNNRQRRRCFCASFNLLLFKVISFLLLQELIVAKTSYWVVPSHDQSVRQIDPTTAADRTEHIHQQLRNRIAN